MKEIKWVCDICGKKHAKEDLVRNEIAISTVEKFMQWIQVCDECIKEVVAFIKSKEK